MAGLDYSVDAWFSRIALGFLIFCQDLQRDSICVYIYTHTYVHTYIHTYSWEIVVLPVAEPFALLVAGFRPALKVTFVERWERVNGSHMTM